jgi:hypothetical protein
MKMAYVSKNNHLASQTPAVPNLMRGPPAGEDATGEGVDVVSPTVHNIFFRHSE